LQQTTQALLSFAAFSFPIFHSRYRCFPVTYLRFSNCLIISYVLYRYNVFFINALLPTKMLVPKLKRAVQLMISMHLVDRKIILIFSHFNILQLKESNIRSGGSLRHKISTCNENEKASVMHYQTTHSRFRSIISNVLARMTRLH